MNDDAMNETMETALPTPRPIVYVRPLRRDQIADAPENLPDGMFYALHDENGRPIAIFDDRLAAMAAARAHDMTPVSAH